MAKFLVRRATTDDLPRLVELWTEQRDIETQLDPRLAVWEAVGDVDNLPARMRDDVADTSPDAASRVLVAIATNKIVGFVWGECRYSIERHEHTGVVMALVVDPHDGQGGVGSVLLDGAVAWLRDVGAKHLIIENVPRHVAVQHAFWRAKGAGVVRETLYLPIRQGGDDA